MFPFLADTLFLKGGYARLMASTERLYHGANCELPRFFVFLGEKKSRAMR